MVIARRSISIPSTVVMGDMGALVAVAVGAMAFAVVFTSVST